jgi:competence protein ComGF
MESPLFENYKNGVMKSMSAYNDIEKIIALLWIIIKMLFMRNCRGE